MGTSRKFTFDKVKGLFRKSRKPPLRERVAMSINLLETTSRKLNSLYGGLKARDEKFFAKCIDAEMSNNYPMAVIYANECAEIRKMASTVVSSELALEQATLRLQTIDKLGDVLVTIGPIVSIVEETKERLAKTIPAVANRLDEVNLMLKSSYSETSSTEESEVSNNSNEAAKILNEANRTAEEKIREKFPKLPDDFETEEFIEFRIPVALTAVAGEMEVEYKDPFEQQVYEYLKACNGRFSLNRCANFLEVPPTDVKKAISKLKEEGRISSK